MQQTARSAEQVDTIIRKAKEVNPLAFFVTVVNSVLQAHLRATMRLQHAHQGHLRTLKMHARDVSQEHLRPARARLNVHLVKWGATAWPIAPVAIDALQGEPIHRRGCQLSTRVSSAGRERALRRTKRNVETAALGSIVKGQDGHHAHHVMKALLILYRAKALRTHVSHVLLAFSIANRPRHHARHVQREPTTTRAKVPPRMTVVIVNRGASILFEAGRHARHAILAHSMMQWVRECAVNAHPARFYQALAQTPSPIAKCALVPSFQAVAHHHAQPAPVDGFCLLSYPSVGIPLPIICRAPSVLSAGLVEMSPHRASSTMRRSNLSYASRDCASLQRRIYPR